jgi:multidrug resistance efflux pump
VTALGILASVDRGLFRPQAVAAYVNMDTRGSLLSVAPPSVRWLLAGASALFLALLAIATLGHVRVSVEGRGEIRPSEKPLAVVAPSSVKIRAVRCAQNARVMRGDVLFELDKAGQDRSLAACEQSADRLKEARGSAARQLADWLKSAAPAAAIAYLLEAQVEHSDEALHQEESRCEKVRGQAAVTTINSPRDGTVVDVTADVGAPAKEGAILAMVLPASASLVAYVHVPESEIGRITEGTPVLLRYDAYPFENYGMGEGHVVRVVDDAALSEPSTPAPHAATDDDAVLEVVIDRVPPAMKLRAGLRFTASVITGERSIASLIFPR